MDAVAFEMGDFAIVPPDGNIDDQGALRPTQGFPPSHRRWSRSGATCSTCWRKMCQGPTFSREEKAAGSSHCGDLPAEKSEQPSLRRPPWQAVGRRRAFR